MLRLKAYAKINLSLKIRGRRPDGYHELDSLMQSVSLGDQLTLSEIPSGIQIATTNLKLPNDSRNLAYQAAALFDESQKSKVKGQNSGIKIYIEKNIPLAAGLAGGSADAAAVLYGRNEMAAPSLRVTRSSLLELGAQLGSDVPFCLVGGNCTVTGRGEQVKRTMFHGKRYFVLVTPDVEVPTKWAYDAWDEMTNSESCLPAGRLRIMNEGRRNDLESVVVRRFPVIQKVKERMVELGAGFAQMSGSGPTVFGIVPDPKAGERIAAAMKKEYSRSFAVESVDVGVEELKSDA